MGVNALISHEDDKSAQTIDILEVTRSSVMALVLGVFCILTVPILKMHTELPPYFGMLFALGLMWLLSDLLGLKPAAITHDEHLHESGGPSHAGVVAALHKVDLAGLLFFAGVLQSVAALDSANIL